MIFFIKISCNGDDFFFFIFRNNSQSIARFITNFVIRFNFDMIGFFVRTCIIQHYLVTDFS
ncbi:DUF3718 domain-containing protein [Flavobacterium sp. LMO6]|uniref:DUF3718 domain-containing protein n=1 Tax=Flavobacterium sp. LMO6 TaxID=2654243 RepID=UPI00351B9799